MNEQCFAIEPLDDIDKRAIRALQSGEATPAQQQLAIYVIVNKLSRSHDVLFVPNDHDQTAFLAGRGYVGQQILKICKTPIGKFEDVESKAPIV